MSTDAPWLSDPVASPTAAADAPWLTDPVVSKPNPAVDFVESIPTGVAKGLISTATLPAAINDAFKARHPGAGDFIPGLSSWPSFSDLWDNGAKQTGLYHEPQGEGGQWGQTLGEGGTALLSGKAPAIALGMGAAAAAKAVRDAFPNVPYLPEITSALILMAGGPKALSRPPEVRLAQTVVKGSETGALDVATQAAADAKAATGAPVLPVHYLPDDSPAVALAAAARTAAAEGGPMRAALGAERDAMRAGEIGLINQQAAGTVDATSREAVNNTVAAAREVPRQASNAAATPLYNMAAAGPTLTDADVQAVQQALLRAQAARNASHPSNPGAPPYAAYAEKVASVVPKAEVDPLATLADLPPAQPPAGTWNDVNDIGQLATAQGKAAFKEGGGASPTSLSLADIGDTLHGQPTPGRPGGVVNANSPPLAAADVIGTTGRDWLDVPGLKKDLPSLFSPQATGSDVSRIADSLQRAGVKEIPGTIPDAFPMAVKTKMADAAAAPNATPGSWAEKVFGRVGDPAAAVQRENALSAVENAALQNGMSATEAAQAAKGAGVWADVMQVVEKGQARLPTNADVSKIIAEASIGNFSRALRFITPSMEGIRTWTAANALDAATRHKLLKVINDVMTTPEGLKKLQQLANWDWKPAIAKAGIKWGIGTNAAAGNY